MEQNTWDRLPLDEEGYIKSFAPTGEDEQIIAFWKNYGIVVIRDIITEEEIEKTLEEIWTTPRLLGNGMEIYWRLYENLIQSSIYLDIISYFLIGKVDRNDPSTWNNGQWPTEYDLSKGGFLSHFMDVDLPVSWNNRQNPKLYRIFCLLLNRPELWVSFDRYGFVSIRHTRSYWRFYRNLSRACYSIAIEFPIRSRIHMKVLT
jgi:hypothetical protein